MRVDRAALVGVVQREQRLGVVAREVDPHVRRYRADLRRVEHAVAVGVEPPEDLAHVRGGRLLVLGRVVVVLDHHTLAVDLSTSRAELGRALVVLRDLR